MLQMEEACNINMAGYFNPSWINLLGKSMMYWFKKYAPGFMCVVHKPQTFCNERHTLCCSLTPILWRSHKVKGKDSHQELGKKE